MIVFELTGKEDHPVYRDLGISNGLRQYDFLRSVVSATVALGRPLFSAHVLKALNFHAIGCLHAHAGQYRPCEVEVGKDANKYEPPPWWQVESLMEDFINEVNRMWVTHDPLFVATFVLWKLNAIHPFINGNGRTARAACYFVICVSANGWLAGKTILPELIKLNRPNYVAALKAGDQSLQTGQLDLTLLHALLVQLLQQQMATATATTQAQQPSNVTPINAAAAAAEPPSANAAPAAQTPPPEEPDPPAAAAGGGEAA